MITVCFDHPLWIKVRKKFFGLLIGRERERESTILCSKSAIWRWYIFVLDSLDCLFRSIEVLDCLVFCWSFYFFWRKNCSNSTFHVKNTTFECNKSQRWSVQALSCRKSCKGAERMGKKLQLASAVKVLLKILLCDNSTLPVFSGLHLNKSFTAIAK